MPILISASTEALSGTVTYTNNSGSNATLTIAAGASIFIDGVELDPSAGIGVLIKNEALAAHNGAYSINAYNGGVSDTVLERIDTQFLEPYAIATGVNNIGTIWFVPNIVGTIGTDPVVFIRAG